MKKGLLSVLLAAAGAAAGAGVMARAAGRSADEAQAMSDKHLALFLMMNEWVKLKQEGRSLAAFFEAEGYKEIAVYGMSYAGERLLEELKGSRITVKYGIDKRSDEIYEDIELFSPDDDLEDVDAVVVTAIAYFEEIRDRLSVKMDCPVISLEDAIYEA